MGILFVKVIVYNITTSIGTCWGSSTHIFINSTKLKSPFDNSDWDAAWVYGTAKSLQVFCEELNASFTTAYPDKEPMIFDLDNLGNGGEMFEVLFNSVTNYHITYDYEVDDSGQSEDYEEDYADYYSLDDLERDYNDDSTT